MQGIETYFNQAGSNLSRVLEEGSGEMQAVAEIWADAIMQDRLTYTFGSGHSRFIAGELYWRAGGMASVMMINDPMSGSAERLEGVAEVILKRYDIQSGDLLFVISNSGINPLPLEMALEGRKAGAVVIAVTNVAQSQQSQSRHSSGQRLFEVASHILDTRVPFGDAVVPLEVNSSTWHVAPVSTLVSVAMLNAVVAETAHILVSRGVTPPVLVSANVPEGDENNRHLCDKYWQRLAEFPRRQPT